jgi:hypothetical protein
MPKDILLKERRKRKREREREIERKTFLSSIAKRRILVLVL